MKQYFIFLENEQIGPLTFDELSSKKISKTTKVWYDGMEDWKEAGEIEELSKILISTPPPINPNKTSTPIPPKIKNMEHKKVEIKKSNLKRNLYVVGGILASLIIICVIINNSQSNFGNVQPIYDADETQNVDASQSERDRINAQITAKNMNFRNFWWKYLDATPNQYEYRNIGGIFNLAVTFTNNTDCKMDEIIVDVKYIKDSGGIYKTEQVKFYNVLAGTQQTEPAPDSDRGTSVQLEVSKIYSKKMHFYYPSNNGNVDDPYFYKE